MLKSQTAMYLKQALAPKNSVFFPMKLGASITAAAEAFPARPPEAGAARSREAAAGPSEAARRPGTVAAAVMPEHRVEGAAPPTACGRARCCDGPKHQQDSVKNACS